MTYELEYSLNEGRTWHESIVPPFSCRRLALLNARRLSEIGITYRVKLT